jgi:hypothetical protein
MAHEIETHGTQAAAVFARKDAWHRLGTTVRDRAFTAEEAMRLGHLGGWDVRKLLLTTAEVSEGGVTAIEVPGGHGRRRPCAPARTFLPPRRSTTGTHWRAPWRPSPGNA